MTDKPDIYDRFIDELTATRRPNWHYLLVWATLVFAFAGFVEFVKWLFA